ncbi:MAG: selenium-dependent molybdenum cofactor biosynthesis protein YqeB [Dehalococcoidia bacterium]|nr:selenium-dependent molybdenum cofactor biosynthesis protein YqeB [Dehalococcoidia bacterium]
MRKLSELIVLIKGGGEVASGIAYRLHRSRFRVCLTEIQAPLAVCRGTCFSEAVFDGTKTIEGVTAELVPVSMEQVYRVWRSGNIPIVVDPELSIKPKITPDVLVDAIMAKRETGIRITDAPLVIGVGPGFSAGKNVHLVIESNHSNNLGKVILSGEAEADTGEPVAIAGLTRERVLWAPEAGVFTTSKAIGDLVEADEVIAYIDEIPLKAPLSGMLRGLLRSGVKVLRNTKLIEVGPPVNDKSICLDIRDKIRAISGGVLEAIMMSLNTPEA